ncbi:hypothetical protein B0A55_10174, partial [Friedmanniomyces simplex]
MDFASLMKSQISSAQPAETGKKYLKRSEVEAQRQSDYLREQEELEKARLERLEKKRTRDEDEEERTAAREAKKKRLAEESRKLAEEEAQTEENARRKRIGLPELERKGDGREGTPLKEGEEDIADEELREKLREINEPRVLFGETHIQRLRRYRKLTAKALAPTMSKGPIPTILQLLDEKDMKVPEAVPEDAEAKTFLRRQIASYFDMVLSEWQFALSRRPIDVKESFSGKQAYNSFLQARDNLTPLIRKLETNTLPDVLLTAINEIVHLMQTKCYVKANDAYLRLSIGKAAWPIGVTMVGIHERSARERLHETEKAGGQAHILADETTRKMLQGIKRCLSFAQTSEKKIDRMGDRLVNIEKLLQRHSNATAPSAPQPIAEGRVFAPTSAITPTTVINQLSSIDETNQALSPTGDAVYDATTLTQSAVASRLIEQAVGNSPGAHQNAELAAALNSLRDMVEKIEDTPSSAELDPPHGLPKAEPAEPPTEAEIERLLRKAEGSLTFRLSPELTMPILEEKFDSVFKSGKEVDAVRRLYVYGLLWNLCTEYGGLEPDPAFAARCQGLAKVFTARIEHAVNDIKLIIPATAEAAYALAMAVSLFSVRLGHAPIIRDYDITVPRLSYCSSIMPSAFLVAFNYSTTLSSLQCKVVEQLYSPLALRQSVEERRKRASRLVVALGEAWDERDRAAASVAEELEYGGIQLLFKESDAVMHHST